MNKFSSDEKIAVGVALVVLVVMFAAFMPAFWSDASDRPANQSAQIR